MNTIFDKSKANVIRVAVATEGNDSAQSDRQPAHSAMVEHSHDYSSKTRNQHRPDNEIASKLELQSTPSNFKEAMQTILHLTEGMRNVTYLLERDLACEGASAYQRLAPEEVIPYHLIGTVFASDLMALAHLVAKARHHAHMAALEASIAVQDTVAAQQDATMVKKMATSALQRSMSIQHRRAEQEKEKLRKQIHKLEKEKKILIDEVKSLQSELEVERKVNKKQMLEQHLLEALVLHERRLERARTRKLPKQRAFPGKDAPSPCPATTQNELVDMVDEASTVSNSSCIGSKQETWQVPGVEREIIGPAGPVGIIIHNGKEGPEITEVNKGSVLEHKVFPGDVLTTIDGVDVRTFNALEAVKLMVERSHFERRLTVVKKTYVEDNKQQKQNESFKILGGLRKRTDSSLQSSPPANESRAAKSAQHVFSSGSFDEQSAVSDFSDFDCDLVLVEAHQEVREIECPVGALGVVIHSTRDGPEVIEVSKDSVLQEKVFLGDMVLSVDGKNVRSRKAPEVVKIMTSRSHLPRRMTVLHDEKKKDLLSSMDNRDQDSFKILGSLGGLGGFLSLDGPSSNDSSLSKNERQSIGRAPSDEVSEETEGSELGPAPDFAQNIGVEREVVCPVGKLGILIHSTSEGPKITEVSKGSVLENQVFVGDLVLSVDGEDVKDRHALDVVKMMTERAHMERRITVSASKGSKTALLSQRKGTDRDQESFRILGGLGGLGGLGDFLALDAPSEAIARELDSRRKGLRFIKTITSRSHAAKEQHDHDEQKEQHEPRLRVEALSEFCSPQPSVYSTSSSSPSERGVFARETSSPSSGSASTSRIDSPSEEEDSKSPRWIGPALLRSLAVPKLID